MTEDRLAVIRAMMSLTDLGDTQHKVIAELVDEVERLLAENADLRTRLAAYTGITETLFFTNITTK